MELLFLAILVLVMILALTSGFPVAFSLPGAAVFTITLAATTGFLFEGSVDAYFLQGGPVQWLTAGVTNFRSLYWDVERDTLIAIPLFIFMGIMLQRSKIAEDLLVTMAQMFGPIPGGLGISVVFVGALLAATTGIVGATVIAMGLISLPAMLRSNYSKSLACGTICASGTLGQIIPPSIVLIILADQLSSAADQASSLRKAAYKAATGEFTMPSALDITSASAGDMFMGAFVPGLVLVGLYMAYILISALIKPDLAPPVHYGGNFDRKFALRVLLALVPPLTLIFAVLGSIISGIATVNQAGAIGAIGAMIMGSYRLSAGKRGAYLPAILAIVSIVAILVVLSFYDINVKNIRNDEDVMGIALAGIAVTGLMVAILWSTWRAFRIDDTLHGVMVDTAKTTSMVFIILIGAAMLTSAFRAFGGEELVKHFLTGLPGGFWSQFIVVMAVIFLLGFFLDFIEIAVVVVPIVAPILLADPQANITAVWLGVMVGLNIQTSFLTPPFGFALFYLRGVAPPSVRTMDIYRGAVAFIALQLIGLTIAGAFPSLVNYLPERTHLTSETAPPPMNPRLQACIEEYVFGYYGTQGDALRAAMDRIGGVSLDYLPKNIRRAFNQNLERGRNTFELVAAVKAAQAEKRGFEQEYRPLHTEVRRIEKRQRKIEFDIERREQSFTRVSRSGNPDAGTLARITAKINERKQQVAALKAQIPPEWDVAYQRYQALAKAEKKALGIYRSNVDSAYEAVTNLSKIISEAESLTALRKPIADLKDVAREQAPKPAMAAIKAVERELGKVTGASHIKNRLSKARRALKGKQPKAEKALALLDEGLARFDREVIWRKRARTELLPELTRYEAAIHSSIGLRLQKRLTTDQAEQVASCRAVPKDISLHF